MGATVIFPNMPVPLEDGQQDSIYDCTGSSDPVLFLSDTETYQLTFQVTAEQWVKLFSAATAGADLLYPDQSIDVVFPLRQAVDCMPTFCQAVQNCIETVPGIQITLIQITNYWGSEGEDGELPPVTAENPEICVDCDLDNLFGACTQMVDLIDQTITDIFEIIEAITNSVELANEVLELVPGLNFLASVLDIANVLQEQLAENYAAAYTTLVRDDLRCALFCAVRDDCTLDFEAMATVFSDLAGQSILTLDLADFIEFFTTGTFSGVEVVYASFWFVAGMIQYGGKVFNIDSEKLVKMSASFLNDPDSDWSTLCDCPTDWSHELTGTALQDFFTPFALRATWDTDGWVIGALSNAIQLNSDMFTSTQVNSVQMIYSGEAPSGDPNAYQFWIGPIAGPADQSGLSNTWTPEVSMTQFALSMGKNSGTYTGKLVQVNISGYGIDPLP